MLLTGLLCGILLGFVMQRGRFCITGAFRDMYVTKITNVCCPSIGDTVQSIGFFLLKEIGVLKCRSSWKILPFSGDYRCLCIWHRHCSCWRLCDRFWYTVRLKV